LTNDFRVAPGPVVGNSLGGQARPPGREIKPASGVTGTYTGAAVVVDAAE
jgi:hypothetical protein